MKSAVSGLSRLRDRSASVHQEGPALGRQASQEGRRGDRGHGYRALAQVLDPVHQGAFARLGQDGRDQQAGRGHQRAEHGRVQYPQHHHDQIIPTRTDIPVQIPQHQVAHPGRFGHIGRFLEGSPSLPGADTLDGSDTLDTSGEGGGCLPSGMDRDGVAMTPPRPAGGGVHRVEPPFDPRVAVHVFVDRAHAASPHRQADQASLNLLRLA